MLYEKWIQNWKAALAENFFLRSAVILLAAGLILNATVFRENTRIIVVPPTMKDSFWIERGKAAPEYLEQMAVFVSTLVGNLSPRSAEYNIEVLLSYIDPDRLHDVRDDLKSQAQYIKKNNITQSFYPDSTAVAENEQSVTIDGNVTRYIGAIKVSEERIRFYVKFRVTDYNMKVTELSVDYPNRKENERKKDKDAVFPAEKNPNTMLQDKAKAEEKAKGH